MVPQCALFFPPSDIRHNNLYFHPSHSRTHRSISSRYYLSIHPTNTTLLTNTMAAVTVCNKKTMTATMKKNGDETNFPNDPSKSPFNSSSSVQS